MPSVFILHKLFLNITETPNTYAIRNRNLYSQPLINSFWFLFTWMLINNLQFKLLTL